MRLNLKFRPSFSKIGNPRDVLNFAHQSEAMTEAMPQNANLLRTRIRRQKSGLSAHLMPTFGVTK